MNNSGTSSANSGELTQLLHRYVGGEIAAFDELLPLVYADLKAVAANLRRRKGGGAQTTEIVHNAYLRLSAAHVDFVDRGHFFAVAANVMRNAMTDEARTLLRAKRGGGAQHLELSVLELAGGDDLNADQQASLVVALHQALEKLERLEPRWAQVVELRFFAGLDEEAIAEVLGVSTRTVRRDWVKAKAWLMVALRNEEVPLVE